MDEDRHVTAGRLRRWQTLLERRLDNLRRSIPVVDTAVRIVDDLKGQLSW